MHTTTGTTEQCLPLRVAVYWGNNHCRLTNKQNSRQTDNHTEGTLGYVLIMDTHLVDIAYICWRVEPLGWVGEKKKRSEGMETGSKYNLP